MRTMKIAVKLFFSFTLSTKLGRSFLACALVALICALVWQTALPVVLALCAILVAELAFMVYTELLSREWDDDPASIHQAR